MHSTITPAYWKKSLKVLASSHPELATIIAQLPKGACIERKSSSAFTSLLRSITGQQISMKAAASIWNKLQDTIGIITPETILENTDSRYLDALHRSSGMGKGVGENVVFPVAESRRSRCEPRGSQK